LAGRGPGKQALYVVLRMPDSFVEHAVGDHRSAATTHAHWLFGRQRQALAKVFGNHRRYATIERVQAIRGGKAERRLVPIGECVREEQHARTGIVRKSAGFLPLFKPKFAGFCHSRWEPVFLARDELPSKLGAEVKRGW